MTAGGDLSVRKAAWAAHHAGLNVLPPREDGSKAPLGKWQQYQARKSNDDELRGWYGPRTGVGAICGAISGNLELFEFDDYQAYLDYKKVALATGLGDLVERLETGYLEQSPSGGIHWFYRCPEISGNTSLARRPSTPEELASNPGKKVQVLIETRGEGGYAIVAPSNGRVHQTGKPYVRLQGGFDTIITITPDERSDLWALARTFDQMRPGHDGDAVKPPASHPGGRPGDDFNARSTWEELLTQHGWARVYQRGDTTYWRRPGKDQGVSATTNYQGSDLLYVFSTSTGFEAERGYRKFSAYTLLNHGGDFRAAARALAQEGYGEPYRYTPPPPGANGHSGDGIGGPKGPFPPIDLTEDLPPAPRQFVLDCVFQQEYGDAQLLAYLYPDRLIYDHAGKQWYEWGGHYWKADRTARVRRLIAGQLAAQYLILSAQMGKELEAAEQAHADDPTNDAQAEEIRKLNGYIKSLRERAAQLRQLRRVQRILDFAGSFLGLAGSEWDRKPGLLACSNGVINLRTGVISPGDPADYIRSACPTEWQGLDAPAPRFQLFIREIFDEVEDAPQDLSDYIQEAIGYGATGTVLEHILLIFFGPRGRNGKDTLLETLAYVLGPDIAGPCSPEVFIAQERKGSAGGPSEHLYGLMGKRLVWGSESSEDARLNGNQIKLITGGGQIVCRALFGHQVTFHPTHLPILLTNFRPRVPDQDDALWERVHLVPFTLRFVDKPQTEVERQKDPVLKDKLKEEAPGILAWIVRGAMRWYERGRLEAPEGVKLATRAYKADMNPLAEFITDSCIFDPKASISNAALWKGYLAWVDMTAERFPVGRKTFSQRIEALEGVTKGHSSDKRTRLWTGIDLVKGGTL